ncbi:MAG: DMT family transporter [Actinomycetota bacterium]
METTTDDTPRHDLAIAALFVAVVFWSTGPLLVRGISAPSLAAAPVRCIVAVPVMWIAARVTGGRITREVWVASIFPGVFFAGTMLFAFLSFSRTTVAHASLIVALQPVVMLFLAPVLFAERITVRKVGFALTALGGIAMVVIFGNSKGDATLLGDFFSVLNLGSYCTYIVMTKRVRDRNMHSGAFLTAVLVVASGALLPIGVVSGADFGQIGGNDWWLILGQVFIIQLLGFGVVTWSSRYIEVTLASIINLLSPALSAVWAWFIFDQSMQALQIVGGIVMLGAVAGVVATRSRPSDTSSNEAAVET